MTTVKNVLDFISTVLQYINLFGTPYTEFREQFHEKVSALGKLIQQEIGETENQKVSRLSLLGPQSKEAFKEIQTWCSEKGINFNS